MGPYEPVLRVADGDSIATTTVDARGFDRNRENVTPRGNPQTGPFYVERAEPGARWSSSWTISNQIDATGPAVRPSRKTSSIQNTSASCLKRIWPNGTWMWTRALQRLSNRSRNWAILSCHSIRCSDVSALHLGGNKRSRRRRLPTMA